MLHAEKEIGDVCTQAMGDMVLEDLGDVCTQAMGNMVLEDLGDVCTQAMSHMQLATPEISHEIEGAVQIPHP